MNEIKQILEETTGDHPAPGEVVKLCLPQDPLQELFCHLPLAERAKHWRNKLPPNWCEAEVSMEYDCGVEICALNALKHAKELGLSLLDNIDRRTRSTVLSFVYGRVMKCDHYTEEDRRAIINRSIVASGINHDCGMVGSAINDPTDKRQEWEIPTEACLPHAMALFTTIACADQTCPIVMRQGGNVIEVAIDQAGRRCVMPVSSERAITLLENYVKPYGFNTLGAKVPKRLRIADVAPILACREAIAKLPELRVFANAPVIVPDGDNGSRIIKGYDAATGIYVHGGQSVSDVNLPDAVEGLLYVLNQFRFATEGDKSRAIASMITPALILGGWPIGRAPVDLAEADKSQSGKGYRQSLTAAIYREKFCKIVAKRGSGGVGSLDESFDTALLTGRPFIQFDNFRGKLDSAKLESFMTEDNYQARVPHQAACEIDPTRRMIFMTSNGLASTPDFVNRASVCRIRKQEGIDFEDMLGVVAQNQNYFLGCILTVVEEWAKRGCPRTDETRHSFRSWCQSLDWIVQHFFKLAPLMDGHEEVQNRLSDAWSGWLRGVALALRASGLLDRPQTCTDLLEVSQGASLHIPNVQPFTESGARRAIGSSLKRAFRGSSILSVEEFQVERSQIDASDEVHHTSSAYIFSVRRP